MTDHRLDGLDWTGRGTSTPFTPGQLFRECLITQPYLPLNTGHGCAYLDHFRVHAGIKP